MHYLPISLQPLYAQRQGAKFCPSLRKNTFSRPSETTRVAYLRQGWLYLIIQYLLSYAPCKEGILTAAIQAFSFTTPDVTKQYGNFLPAVSFCKMLP